jgi:hypothetical protein
MGLLRCGRPAAESPAPEASTSGRKQGGCCSAPAPAAARDEDDSDEDDASSYVSEQSQSLGGGSQAGSGVDEATAFLGAGAASVRRHAAPRAASAAAIRAPRGRAPQPARQRRRAPGAARRARASRLLR